MTARIQRLRERLLQSDERGVFYERMTLLMEAKERWGHLDNGGLYAHSFAYLLDNMTVEIRPDELVVGIAREIVPDAEEEARFLEAAKAHNFMATELFTFDPLGLLEITDPPDRFAPEWLNSYGHLIPDYPRLLRLGYAGIRREVEERMGDDALGAEGRRFLECAGMACDAMCRFALRYADCADALGKLACDAEEVERLEWIESACRGCAGGGAADFRQAVQLVWFTNLVLHTVCGARDYGFGRMDQYLFPYYRRDVEAGRLSREEALELLECLFLKCSEIIGLGWEGYKPKRINSVNSIQYILLAGSDGAGGDATNEVSRLCLEAMESLKIKQPTLNVRYHPDIDRAFFQRACQVAASGLGYPSFFNDGVVIPALEDNGIAREDAVEYGYYGCNNSFLPGLEDELRESWHSLPKLLELALNRGACLRTGKVVGAVTPSAYKLGSMEDLLEALRVQMASAIARAKDHVERGDAYWNELKPFSFESVLMTHCVERASSINAQGSKYRHFNQHLVGLATAANALYAIRRLVFQEGRLTLPELVALLRDNWRGNPALRREVWEIYPKFGNDDPEVDDLAARVAELFVEEVQRASPMDNGRVLYPSIYSLWHQRDMGRLCAASADGRLEGEDLSESQSPVYGTETQGPTAALNSVAKLPLNRTPSGGINVKFQPRLFQMEGGHRNLMGLLEGYFLQGGMHMQINVVSRETLLDAQKHPEKHKNLLVRVVGYSAYFVSLSPEQQAEIIHRTEL